MGYRLRVHWLKKSLLILLAALWLPAVSHCDLEHLPGFAFLACCELPTEASEHNNDCQTDNCGTVESGLYKLEEHSDAAPAPILILDVAVLVRLAATPESLEPPGLIPSSLPPELPRRWQFLSRTAAAPRAPSLAS